MKPHQLPVPGGAVKSCNLPWNAPNPALPPPPPLITPEQQAEIDAASDAMCLADAQEFAESCLGGAGIANGLCQFGAALVGGAAGVVTTTFAGPGFGVLVATSTGGLLIVTGCNNINVNAVNACLEGAQQMREDNGCG